MWMEKLEPFDLAQAAFSSLTRRLRAKSGGRAQEQDNHYTQGQFRFHGNFGLEILHLDLNPELDLRSIGLRGGSRLDSDFDNLAKISLGFLGGSRFGIGTPHRKFQIFLAAI